MSELAPLRMLARGHGVMPVAAERRRERAPRGQRLLSGRAAGVAGPAGSRKRSSSRA